MHISEPRPQLNDMLRETRANLVRFSQMADTKANILLSISSVLLTISLTKVTDPAFTLSIFVLVGFLLVTIFLALITVIPNLRVFQRKKRSINDPDYCPLYFGDYVDIPYDDYAGHLEEIMNDSDRTYEVMIKEIHHAGIYLQKTKYNVLTYGYTFFFIGLIASTAIYFVQSFL